MAAAVARPPGRPSVELTGARNPLGVRLVWRSRGVAAAYQVAVARDGGSAQVVLDGATGTAASFALDVGHSYAFTVNALDGAGGVAATSEPYWITIPNQAGP